MLMLIEWILDRMAPIGPPPSDIDEDWSDRWQQDIISAMSRESIAAPAIEIHAAEER